MLASANIATIADVKLLVVWIIVITDKSMHKFVFGDSSTRCLIILSALPHSYAEVVTIVH